MSGNLTSGPGFRKIFLKHHRDDANRRVQVMRKPDGTYAVQTREYDGGRVTRYTNVVITREDLRDLFNAIGVELHKGEIE